MESKQRSGRERVLSLTASYGRYRMHKTRVHVHTPSGAHLRGCSTHACVGHRLLVRPAAHSTCAPAHTHLTTAGHALPRGTPHRHTLSTHAPRPGSPRSATAHRSTTDSPAPAIELLRSHLVHSRWGPLREDRSRPASRDREGSSKGRGVSTRAALDGGRATSATIGREVGHVQLRLQVLLDLVQGGAPAITSARGHLVHMRSRHPREGKENWAGREGELPRRWDVSTRSVLLRVNGTRALFIRRD